MQTFNTVRLEDKLLFPDDMISVVSVVSEVPVASVTYVDQYVFLKSAYTVDVTVGGEVTGTQLLLSGKIYRCKRYTHVDPISGIATNEYKWVNVSFAENGKLMACTNYVFTCQENATKDGGGYTTIIHWEDPIDILNASDPSANAVWAYTVIVRKLGKERPKTVYDGDIVGFSSVRNQYKSGLGFIDLIPEPIATEDSEGGYTYNIFAVTRYGVATGLDDKGGSDVDWDALRRSIWNGTSGLSLGATIPVTHDQYGTLTLQVVDMREDDYSLVNPDLDNNPQRRSVVFMAYKPLPRSAYDVPELATIATTAGNIDNPGDNLISVSAKKSSEYGHCLWSFSNLRQWLNQDVWVLTEDTTWDGEDADGPESKGHKIYAEYQVSTGTYSPVTYKPEYENPKAAGLYEYLYVRSEDNTYITSKCYYAKSGNTYTPVPTPARPGSVSPRALRYYEATWKWRPPAGGSEINKSNSWDVQPRPFAEVDPDAGYAYNDKAMPGFLCGFSADFKNVLATVKVNTITPSTTTRFDHAAGVEERHEITHDKVFIPSYRELIGKEPEGIGNIGWYQNDNCYEGKLFEFYNPERDIPDISKYDRSLIKLDTDGGLCGYYLRTIGTFKPKGASGFMIQDAVHLWRVSVENLSDKLELGLPVMETRECAMTLNDSYIRDDKGNRVAPGIAWCVVIG